MRILVTLIVAFLQFVGAQIVTLLFSFVVPDMGAPENNPWLFVVVAGLAFFLGIAAVGLLAIRLGWLKGAPAYAPRLVLTIGGVFVPLVLGGLLHQIRVASPFLTIAIITGILGFHA